ncbi:hypothetical protein PVAND_007462 [Polypedilum vanderplanki]|uniref:Uncharacterized protein n=1 Tax=Polypedilum vanderplanki TaxID=319348 RepID=A0A9J6C7D8_POLVA|nr:hypothetical protein PVAND_007462 [Polypedilum vanderplanki]
MSKYKNFDNESKKRLSIFGSLLTSKSDDQPNEIYKMPQSYTQSSPYSKINDFNAKTKIVCQKTDLSLFLDQCKVIFIGDCETGKTSLINRFTSSTFDHCYRATHDVDFQTKYFEILNIAYTIGIWDLSGEEKYKILNQPYYKNANVIVAVFDLTKPSTLINACRWMKEALSANEKNDPIRFLVGTKSDLLTRKALERIEAHAEFIAQEVDAEYFSTSSRDDIEVTNLFKRFVSLSFDNSVQRLIRPPDYNVIKNNIKSE